ncbi:MAG: alanine racemase [Betaproteobacteria bacterium]|jgi:alanine racemase|nr:alanine racemase [Betaproteobacteria bacterium]
MARPLYAQLSLPALRANLARARELAPRTELLAVVKANAYGHGLMRLLPALSEADGLALVELDAAIALRAAHYMRRILLLEGFFAPDELPEVAARRIAVVVHSEDQVRMLEAARLARPLEVFVKINTGMNRLGIPPAAVVRTVERLNQCESVAVLRLMTHLARADEDDGLKEPVAMFTAACRGMPYPRSLANSAGVVRYAETGGDIVRPGIMLYGATPFADRSAEDIGVRPVMTLRSEIIAVQRLRPNDCVGYGATYVASGERRIGVVACGYADGYPRCAPNGTPVLVCGRKARIAGRVSMDMITVDITEIREADVGSPVVLWGEGLPVDDVASAASTVGYELLCAVAPRVPFVVSNVDRLDFEV